AACILKYLHVEAETRPVPSRTSMLEHRYVMRTIRAKENKRWERALHRRWVRDVDDLGISGWIGSRRNQMQTRVVLIDYHLTGIPNKFRTETHENITAYRV
ncbi:hypothetical protein, partial [Pseudomonas aeruginosa]|uniref:hypothetical protein n=6 Tax=Pseudomonas aeruginosa TaxID=287 RepID=UPI00287F9ECD